jgi:carbon storage regulator
VLISRRKEGESLSIGEDIEIRIVDVRRNKVVLGIIAPRDVKIAAAKLTDMAMANTMAAVNSADIDQYLHPPREESENVVLLLKAAGSKETPK